MWIMLIKKLPTVVSPPKLSIFWAEPWPGNLKAMHPRHKANRSGILSHHPEMSVEEDEIYEETMSPFGVDPEWDNAVKIFYKGSEIRVFPHEFSILSDERMRLYIFGDNNGDPSHQLVMADVATPEQFAINEILDEATKPIHDAALLDGASEAMATAVALGMDVSLPDSQFPPVGWYRCRVEYAEIFCKPYEMEETYEGYQTVQAQN